MQPSPTTMAVSALLMVFLALIGYTNAAYCLCNPALNNSVLQKNIDFACKNGAECARIHPKVHVLVLILLKITAIMLSTVIFKGRVKLQEAVTFQAQLLSRNKLHLVLTLLVILRSQAKGQSKWKVERYILAILQGN
ncbi:uncharacterized protein LOC143577303 [Bidens hawaiensis]|uniref:uncharacterized protein LOC143577303 n=1 Tax=Bidens hawaiensis TaxID=980011 RepID=UPI00404B6AEB